MATWIEGKVCIVTGATDGIGRVAAEELAKIGARLILVGRNARKGEAMVRAIRHAAPDGEVEFERADLSDLGQVRALAATFQERHDSLHVLLNNAGAYYTRRRVTADGFEMTWALNHLAYFLLTGLLLDCLRAAGDARVINVASGVHQDGTIDFDDLQGERRYSGWAAYKQSKLANVMFTYALHRRMAGTGVSANCLHPGFVATRFGHNNIGPVGIGLRVAQQLSALRAADGARTSVYLAASDEVAGTSGLYFYKSGPARSSPVSHDEAAQERLWKISEEMTGINA